MRVSTQMFSDNYLTELDRHQARLFRLQQQAASGKRILSPSDDPTATRQAVGQHASLSAIQQYQTNLSDAQSFVDHSAAVATNITGLVDQAQQLALRGASDSLGPEERKALGQQIDQLIEEAAGNANDSTLGRYTLAGVNTTTAPYTVARDAQGHITSVTAPAGAVSGEIDRQVGQATTLKVNLNGSDIFGGAGSPPGSIDYFQTLIQLRDALNSNDAAGVRALTPTLAALHDQTQGQVTVAGARSQRLQHVQDALSQQQLAAQSSISSLEDVDVAQTALDLQTEQAVYQQALAVGIKILSLTLGPLTSAQP